MSVCACVYGVCREGGQEVNQLISGKMKFIHLIKLFS